MRTLLVGALLGVLLLTIPVVAHATDLCVDFTSGESMTLTGVAVPKKGECSPVSGFFTPFFSLVHGSVCRSTDGNSLFVAWTSIFIGPSAVHHASTQIPLPLPSAGTAEFTTLGNGSPVGGGSLSFTTNTCNRPVP